MNTPPGNPYEQGNAQPAPAAPNPYLDAQRAAPAPDLDAAAPSLRTEEQQRLNRKALLFLGGIVLLLMMLAALVLRGNDNDEAPAPETASVDVPTLADAERLPPPSPVDSGVVVDPIAMAPENPVPLSPPPPPMAMEPGPGFDAGPAPPPPPREPTLMERRMGAMAADPGSESATLGGAPDADAYANAALAQAGAAANPAQQPAQAQATRATSARVLGNRDALLTRARVLGQRPHDAAAQGLEDPRQLRRRGHGAAHRGGLGPGDHSDGP